MASKNPLLGVAVRINADATTIDGKPHPRAGQAAVVLDRNGRGNFKLLVDETVVVLPLDAFQVEHPVPQGQAGGIDMLLLEHSAIVPSRTNPRKHFDAGFLDDLAASIKMQGLAQPLLVRPLPGERVQETYTDRRKDTPRPTHEIVAGEQRWRACAIAGVRRVPVLVRHLADEEVLQLQLVENLKRRDLHPMEEAEGLERLRAVTGMSVEAIAERIRKSRSAVYKSIKLLDLLPEARQAFYDGKLTQSTAELVSMRPAHLQLQVLKDITAPDFHGEPMSFRKAKQHIEDRYMLRLGAAPFKITDETLTPQAGSCRDCPKRTGANPQLFDEGMHADTCTDPDCFGAKKDAHYARIRTQAEARGQTVITGREAKEIMPAEGELRGYVRVDDHQDVGGQMKTLRRVLGKDMPATTLVEDPRTHVMVEVLPSTVVGKLLKDHGIVKSDAQQAAKQDDAAARRKAVEQVERTWRLQALKSIHGAAMEQGNNGVSGAVLRLLALLTLDGLSGDQVKHAAGLLELGKVANRDGLLDHVRTVDEGEIEAVLFLLLCEHDLASLVDHASIKPAPAPHIEALAADFDVDVDALRNAAKKELRDALSSRRVDEAAAAVKAGAKLPRPPKATKAEASAAIAAGLQQADNPNAFQPGQRVRIKVDLRKGVDIFNTRGVEADVLHALGDRAWMVQPTTPSFPLSADYTELEAIEP